MWSFPVVQMPFCCAQIRDMYLVELTMTVEVIILWSFRVVQLNSAWKYFFCCARIREAYLNLMTKLDLREAYLNQAEPNRYTLRLQTG